MTRCVQPLREVIRRWRVGGVQWALLDCTHEEPNNDMPVASRIRCHTCAPVPQNPLPKETGVTAAEHLAPVWNLLAAGAERTGHVQASDHDTCLCIAQNSLAALHNGGYDVVPSPGTAGESE